MRADFDIEKNIWFIESPMALNNRQRLTVAKNVYTQISHRIKGEIGERKKRMQERLSLLNPNNLEVRLIGKGEKTLYLEPNSKL